MKSIICFVSLFSLVTAVVLGPDFEKQLVSFVEASMKCHHIAGMTLAIVKGKSPVLVSLSKNDLNLFLFYKDLTRICLHNYLK